MTCELTRRRQRGLAPAWDDIARTPHWQLVHAMDTSVEGWLILVLDRHAAALADLTTEEAGELGPAVRDVSRALHRALAVDKTYLAQFAEHPDHPHVHVHVVARPTDLPQEHLGPGIFALLSADPDSQVSPTRKEEIAVSLRRALVDGDSVLPWDAPPRSTGD